MNEILLIGIAHAVFTIVFIGSKKRKTLSDKILMAWMLMLALPQISNVLGARGADILPAPFDRDFAYSLCLGPFLWLYVESLTGDINKLALRHLFHFLPFMAVVLYKIFIGDTAELEKTGAIWPQLIGIGNIVLLLSYSGVVIWRLLRHSQEMLDNFSSLTTQITLKWLIWLTCIFIAAYLTPLIAVLFSMPEWFRSHGPVITGFIFALSFFGLKQTQIFATDQAIDALANGTADITIERVGEDGRSKSNDEPHEKYERSGLTEDKAKDYLQRLEHYTKTKAPYLDPNLTIEKLARQLRIPRHYLTQILSEQLGKNFYLYINDYRIDHVKGLIAAPNSQHMTLLDMAYKSGFNSKSTFNSVFKKITGLTPSQYKIQRLNSAA
ncbi:helix-turn-helix transcriptional regulator [Cohaesibacter celericrescens]|uniref:HTH araC/xylS-type domain-containing protein n=1 Tax=Cohaesibacter celericrescens TaxID=2067669 RepID=A0A2N5XRW2_9HYPH|nr:helix-turn-helix transcriptional regulator [Cohaesibacter celericrescens]PLW77195.1 hypothetical protein C0081_10625 [Cohaesibacter celericrescens]